MSEASITLDHFVRTSNPLKKQKSKIVTSSSEPNDVIKSHIADVTFDACPQSGKLHYLSYYRRAYKLSKPIIQAKRRMRASSAITRRSRQMFRVEAMSGGTRGWGLKGELKAIDTDISNTAVATAESVICINKCTQGSDIGNRVGRQIMMKSVQIRGFMSTVGTNNGDLVFWAVVYDRQSNAAAPEWTDVYTTDAVYPQLRNLDNRKRFKVLGSGYEPMAAVATVDYRYKVVEFYRKLDLPVEFNATNGGTVADITTGGLFFMIRGSSAAGDNDVHLYASSRVRFSDL